MRAEEAVDLSFRRGSGEHACDGGKHRLDEALEGIPRHGLEASEGSFGHAPR